VYLSLERDHQINLVSELQLTVVYPLLHGMGLWKAMLTQQRVQWFSMAAILVLFLR